MIREVERYHGVVLARLVRGDAEDDVSVGVHPDARAAYLVGGRVGLFVKYSTSRLSPWAFTFSREHVLELARIGETVRAVLVALVCGSDGIVCVTTSELQGLLEVDAQGVAVVRASRGPRQKYVVRGPTSKGMLRIGNNEYPGKVFDALKEVQEN